MRAARLRSLPSFHPLDIKYLGIANEQRRRQRDRCRRHNEDEEGEEGNPAVGHDEEAISRGFLMLQLTDDIHDPSIALRVPKTNKRFTRSNTEPAAVFTEFLRSVHGFVRLNGIGAGSIRKSQ